MNRPKKRLLDQVRDGLRLKHYSIRTEHSYISWIKRYVLFHNKRHPQEMGTEVLNMNLDDQINAVRAKRPLSKDETLRVIRALDGVHRLMALLLYGSGLRLMEWFACG
jgi:integrase